MKNKIVAIGIGVVIFVGLVVFIRFFFFSYRDPVIDPEILYPVTYVIDGDTFKTKIKRDTITVRLLGINTPETVDPRKPPECYGKEASYESKLLLENRQVRLKANPNRELRDKYGRYLLYAYRDDELFVNEFLISNGYAREYTYGKPYSLQREFREAEAHARSTGRGLWGTCSIK